MLLYNFNQMYKGLKYSFDFFGKMKKKYMFLLVLSSLEVFMTICIPYFYKYLVILITERDKNGFIHNIGIILFIMLFTIPIAIFSNYYMKKICVLLRVDLNYATFDKIQSIPFHEFEEKSIASFSSIIAKDIDKLVDVYRNKMRNLITSIFYILFSFILLYNIDFILLISGITLSTISVCFSIIFTPYAKKYETNARKEVDNLTSRILEMVKSICIVKIFSLYNFLIVPYKKSCESIRSNRIKFRVYNGIIDAFIYLLSTSAEFIVFFVGLYLVKEGRIVISDAIFASSIVGIMTNGLVRINDFVSQLQTSLVSINRIYELFGSDYEDTAPENTYMEMSKSNKPLSFDDVHFSYTSDIDVLKKVSFDVDRNSLVYIVGSSGSGKSTIFKLLLKFYKPQKGNIFIFGININDIHVKNLRNILSIVPQESPMFDGTVLYNIKLGNLSASYNEVVDAAKKAFIHDDIIEFEKGYNTEVGENGNLLSGGQKQRIAIARAILKNSDIILFDEPTSALDESCKDYLNKSLRLLCKDRTVIIITHDTNAIESYDKVIRI